VQNSLLAEQTVLIEADPKICPNCAKAEKEWHSSSSFHAVFSDHQLRPQTSLHQPTGHVVEFAHRQVSLWHQHSSRPGETSMRAGRCLQLPRSATNLEKLNISHARLITTQVKRFTDKVGSVLSNKLGYDSSRSLCLTWQTVFYNLKLLENLKPPMRHWSRPMLTRQRSQPQADGAKNCWSVLSALEPLRKIGWHFGLVSHCQEISDVKEGIGGRVWGGLESRSGPYGMEGKVEANQTSWVTNTSWGHVYVLN